jgi:anaerobic magnesium-protoporphyrin IX monomethyl ester cyclase
MIALYNPLSTRPGKQPLPLSLMSLAAVLDAREPWTLVDGNVTPDPAARLIELFSGARPTDPSLLAVTVMPGPQLSQAVAVSRRVKAACPSVPIVWGGYFPTQHADVVLASSFVDFVVRSQGEQPLLDLVAALKSTSSPASVRSLSWKDRGSIVHNAAAPLTALDDLPDLPYHRVDMNHYLHSNYLGRRTVAYNSSFGCPFACSFCAVVAMSNRRWLAQSAVRIERTIRQLVARYGVDAVQMHDMDFFISEHRAYEFAERIAPLGIRWWALGRVDRLMQFSEKTWRMLAKSGLVMVFSGAESGADESLRAMNKGGHASASLTLDLASRLRRHGVIPEFSFVLGCPPDPERDLARTFEFIRELKRVNPDTEIVLYTYTPVPAEGPLLERARGQGFCFPASLEEWASPEWRELSMRRGHGVPWMRPALKERIRNFERVVNAFYPTVTDLRLTRARRTLLRCFSAWRYALGFYAAPYELRVLQRFLHYQRPETTGF